jgi:hypothetical protein
MSEEKWREKWEDYSDSEMEIPDGRRGRVCPGDTYCEVWDIA